MLAPASMSFKRGFAWQAFLVPEIWLFLRGLPIDALVWRVVMISAIALLPRPDAGVVVLLARIGVGLLAWRRIDRCYRSKGWTHLTDVQVRWLVEAFRPFLSRPPQPAASHALAAAGG